MKKYNIFQLQEESKLSMYALRHVIRTLNIKARNRKYYFESDLQLICAFVPTYGNNKQHIYESSLNLTNYETHDIIIIQALIVGSMYSNVDFISCKEPMDNICCNAGISII
jgi:hypothetical protein